MDVLVALPATTDRPDAGLPMDDMLMDGALSTDGALTTPDGAVTTPDGAVTTDGGREILALTFMS